MNILFTCAGRRTYLLNYFKAQLDKEDKIVATDMQLSAPALTAADIKVQVPGVYAEDYIDKILDICKNYNIDAIISLNDLELPVLSAQKAKFDKEGIKVIVSNPEVIDICFDKYKTSRFIESIGLKSPKTFISIQEVKKALKETSVSYPLFLKPRWGSGSIGLVKVNNESELIEEYNSLLNKIKETILSTVSGVKDYIIIQEYIEGQEYGLDVMNDLNGNNHGVSVKKKLAMRAGETDKATTVDYPEIKVIGEKIGKELSHIGNLDVDIFEKDGNYYVLELNPRFGGGFPFSYEAGVNFPKAIIEWIKGNEIDDTILIPEYNKTFAKCDYLVEI